MLQRRTRIFILSFELPVHYCNALDSGDAIPSPGLEMSWLRAHEIFFVPRSPGVFDIYVEGPRVKALRSAAIRSTCTSGDLPVTTHHSAAGLRYLVTHVLRNAVKCRSKRYIRPHGNTHHIPLRWRPFLLIDS
ncbi:hypothetical protein OH76DRAFT_1035690 [Lentinus brumalis]|uniref:Uncharacterized protein n=1 Tax=Lentinus brumalis TaxID=2498619 RepID=A0A371CX31_9APHY|nr:hypothetical protein OH76DRAFT_1035690 [Polyporus brumalis]